MSNEVKKITLEDLGYSPFFESSRHTLKFDSFSIARVIAEHKEVYRVVNQHGEFVARITGKQMFGASGREDYPAVGDWVAITELGLGQSVIQGVLTRKSILKRTYGDKNKSDGKTDIQIIGANIDVAFIVESMDRDYNLNRFERYILIARSGGVRPGIILNKIDLISNAELDTRVNEIKDRFNGLSIIPTSVTHTQGLNELRAYISRNLTYCFLGSSGVGKSSLINALIGDGNIKTGAISAYSGRGKHITTGREMYFMKEGGIVIDNPGMREVGMTEISIGIDNIFDQISLLAQKCRFIDCSHTSEPGCAVLAALRSADLDEAKYFNYLNLKEETAFHDLTKYEKRKKDQRFGKFIKHAKQDLERFKQ